MVTTGVAGGVLGRGDMWHLMWQLQGAMHGGGARPADRRARLDAYPTDAIIACRGQPPVMVDIAELVRIHDGCQCAAC